MGCDIHTLAEIQREVYNHETQTSEFVDIWDAIKLPVFTYAYCRENEPISIYNESLTSRPYQGRNYNLFSVLADVRNTRSTSNIFDPSMEYEERDSILPLALPKGIPDNASKGWKKECKRWGLDFHSHSYFTLQELLDGIEAGAFKQVIHQRGYVSLRQYLTLKETGETPDSWSAYTSAPSMKEDEWEALSDEEKKPHLEEVEEHSNEFFGGSVYIRTEWEWNLESAMGEFMRTIEELKLNAPRSVKPGIHDLTWKQRREMSHDELFDYDYTRIRLVFAFDN